MAFGKGKQPQSYGVPVRPALPVAPPADAPQPHQYAAAPAAAPPWETAPAPSWQNAPAPAGFYPPVTAPAPNPYAPTPWTPGAPVYQPAPGAPAYQQQQYLPPFAMTPPKQQSGLRRVINSKPAAAVIVIFVLAGFGNAARGGGDQTAPLTMPRTLDGLPQLTDRTIASALASQRQQLEDRNPGIATALTPYSSADRRQMYVLVAARAPFRESREVADASAVEPIDATSRRAFAHGIVCYASEAQTTVMCIHAARIGFIVFAPNSNDLDAVAAVAQEARSALH